jgi:DNA-binding transcriptional LysR family regulator
MAAMELRHLRYFVGVAEEASVSKAAERLHVSQPAVSRQIRDLEAELGLPLFDRVGRRIELTADGEDLLRRSRDVLAQAEAVRDRARALRGGVVGVLRVGATPQMTQSVLASFLARYRRSRPGIDVRLTDAGGIRLLDLVENGALHVAVSGVLGGARLRIHPLFPIRVLAVSARRPGRKRRHTIDVTDLAKEPLLLLQHEFGTRQLFEAACRAARLRPDIRMESGDPQSLVALAEAGYGVAVVPSTVPFYSRKVEVMPILMQKQSLGIWGGVVSDPRRSIPDHATRFVEELAAHVRRGYPGSNFDRTAPPVLRADSARRTDAESSRLGP